MLDPIFLGGIGSDGEGLDCSRIHETAIGRGVVVFDIVDPSAVPQSLTEEIRRSLIVAQYAERAVYDKHSHVDLSHFGHLYATYWRFFLTRHKERLLAGATMHARVTLIVMVVQTMLDEFVGWERFATHFACYLCRVVDEAQYT